MLTRRDFLRNSSLLALAPTVPAFLGRTAAAGQPAVDRRVLVVVQLDGGNDSLNTLVPFADADYARHRPTLAVPRADVIRVNDAMGLHPALRPLAGLLEAGHLAALPGVGYPNPSRSHFTGMAVWHTARLDSRDHNTGYGWLGSALDPSGATSCAIHSSVLPALRGRRSRALALLSTEEMTCSTAAQARQAAGPETTQDLLAFVRRQALDGYAVADQIAALTQGPEEARYPATALARNLRLVSRLLRSNLGARIYYAVQPGYDTHASQRFAHTTLLGEFAGAVAAFFADLRAAGLAERVALLAFSEFGRTLRENGSAGTDHGTAGCVLIAGQGIRGGIRGSMPSLTDLDGGEPRIATDFRRIYATVLEDWLGLASRDVLGSAFERLSLFND
jgi:uncharacterized protein (DUF1501 family)